ncbi:MAG: aminoglycoside phosphotransferase family protein [Prevotellaceae bacterium]|jgi:Ser/Thr protein kinase RdoA (MazF antagonist)|nr:aminoglycoside phosphotransferase family protein [Prevotellaceae bacterium]
MPNLKDIVGEFAVEGKVEEVKPLGAGHINDSYMVRTQGGAPDYVLQRINHHIFKDVDALQNNIKRVTDHIRKKLLAQHEPDIARKVLSLTPTTQGALYHRSPEGDYWRVMPYIANSKSLDEVSPKLSFLAGRAFGTFQAMLADLPAPPLVETIPNFHNIEARLVTFREAVKNNLAGRLPKVADIVAELEKRADDMCRVEQLHRDGKLPKRINHCDTKVNNMLFDSATDEVLCVVDLDTVMPGFVVSDFGDFMRTGANHGKEDDEKLDNVFFRMDIFEAYAKGYLETAKGFLTPLEVELLPFGAKLLTYMQTVRFLTDYLDGDTYYKVKHPEHNLQRTKAQLKLLLSMEENYPKMLELIHSL